MMFFEKYVISELPFNGDVLEVRGPFLLLTLC
jgi:hypothetical protein